MKILKFKSVQAKFLIWIIPTVTVILCSLAIMIYEQQKKKQLKNIDNFSTQIVQARGNEIGKWLNSLILELQQIAQRNDVQSMNWNSMQEEIKSIAEKRKDTYGFLILIENNGDYFSTIKGKSDVSLKDKDYFKAVIEQGKNFAISNPYYSVTTGNPIFVVNVPIRNKKGELVGSLGGIVYLSTLSKIAGDIKIGENGFGWLIDSEGLVFAHPDSSYILKLNLIKSPEKGFEDLDKLGAKMLSTNNGTGLYKRPDKIESYLIFSKIPISPNWTLGVSLPSSQIFAEVDSLMINLSSFFLITIFIISLLIWLLTRIIISKPLKILINFTNSISQGHLFKAVDINSNDEVGVMAQSLKVMTIRLIEITEKIKDSSDSIASGSIELSNSASQVAQGAGEQAASTEQVSASVEEMVAIINQNSENAEQTEKMALKAAQDIENVMNSVQTTIKAINTIATKISIISEIAGKTDLLAINAAIEAARAGEHGKGFAVVATEVRKLAEKSRIAAIEITQVSTSTVDIAEKSGKLLEEIVPVIKKNADLVREIRAASVEQNTGAEQINNAVQQLAQVTQENSASAEEMATGSEELAQQAEILKETISFFKLKEEDVNNINTITAYQKMLETISILEKNNPSLKEKKIVNSLTETYDNKPIQKTDTKNKGIVINMQNDKLDNEFEKI